MRGRTCLLITHRRAGPAGADEVLVLQAGRVVESWRGPGG
jgi:ABC-type transport system involved in Fe-S cluster assembly fused permease/ATPase subunit